MKSGKSGSGALRPSSSFLVKEREKRREGETDEMRSRIGALRDDMSGAVNGMTRDDSPLTSFWHAPSQNPAFSSSPSCRTHLTSF